MIRIKIIVCIKQVPGTTEIKIDTNTNTLIREGVENIINPFDTYAIEEGVRLKERLIDKGGLKEEDIETVSISMGPPQSENILRESISVGIDKSILISDRTFAGSDTWATSYTLAKAIKKIGDYRMVIVGKQTLDGDTGQVGPELAQILNMPFIGYVSEVIELNVKSNSLKAKRLMEDSYEILETKLPAVISVIKEINIPRVPSLRGKLKAKNAEILLWNKDMLNVREDEVGLKGSFTQVVKIFTPEIKHEVKMIEGDTSKQAESIYNVLKELNVV